MNNHNNYFVIVLLLFSSCLCEIINLSNNQREKFLTGFVEHYNSLPNQIYQSNEGILRSVQQVDDITFIIVAEIKATEIRDVEAFKKLECTATVQESGDDDVTVINHVCQELVPSTTPESTEDYRDTETQVEVTEGTVTSRHVQLENEVQSDTAVTSGEQFIAIPRDQPSSPCVGCTSHVNPQAPGVSDLAALGVRHLDLHEPSVNHSLDTVIDVERQVQVVNGVRYILTLLINSNNCTDVQTENCNFPKTCKVTILVKPWIKLPNGQNHRSILANNCTEPWLYGSDGEVLPEPSGDDIQVRHHTDVQSVPNQERTLTEQELLSIQEQIIPNSEFKEPTERTRSFDATSNTLDVSKQHVFKVESNKQTENSVPVTESEKKEQQSFNINLDTDKKKAIDDMLDFFDFSGFKPKTETEDVISRVRRSYDDDLQVLSLAKDYHGIKNSIENARFMYEMAQVMVDYLNEMDMEVKNRAVKDVVKAEDETENLQRFVYIQARVTIPCDKVECRPTDVVTQICNGVIDSTNVNSPQILNTFCYNENKERDFREVVREVPLDDPILKNLAEEALKKIETESKSKHAMKISKIVSANTQLTSGTLTKFSVIIENINCEKSVPLLLRMNCTVLQQPGSKICEVIVHERRWLNERKISYTCTDRPVEMRISKSTSITNNITVDDPKVVEMLQEAIQYLETQSVKNNKQKIVNINSISSQIIAGFLTKIEFVVGYTNCTDESKTRDNAFQKCEVLKDEALRLCKAQIWDRSWIMDGRQVEVSCDDVLKSNEVQSARNKRSIDSIGGSVRRSGSKENQIDYKKVAEDALQKFMLTSANRQHYVVLKVEKVKTQDEPGKLTRLFFSISPTNCFIQRDGLLSSPKCDVTNPKITFHCSSKVLQNVWIDKNQYFTDCNIQDNEENRNSDEIKERNLSKKYYQLAEESLKKYMQNTEHTQNHKVVRLEKVTTQIVSGLLTNIDFIISPITQDGISNKTIKCHSKILEKQWLGKKDFNVSCQLKYQKENQKKNLKNPKYMQMAVEALEKYIQNKPESDLLRVTFVDKVEEGEGKSFNIRFMASHNEDDDGDTLCYVQFPETQIPKKNMNVECHSIGTVLKQIQITEDDPKFIKYVQWAEESLNDYLQNMNSSQLYTIVRIESVNVLWDESVKTLINFIISPIDLEYSALQGKMCQAEIKEQPWLNKKSKNVKCEPDEELYRAKRQVPGGETEKDPKDPAYMELAKQSLRKYLLENPRITQSSEVDPVVERVTTQVVAGSMTRIDFHFQASGTDSQQDHVTMKCHAEVWERKWLNSKEITVTCSEVKAKVRRDLSGDITEQDPKNPHYMDLAEQSLRKYLLDNPQGTPALEVALVEKVTTQGKSGSLTRIDFLVLSRNDPITMFCNSEVSEQPSLNKVDIKVSCPKIFKTSLAGGLTLQDPSKPEYKLLAVESLQKYVRESEYTDVYEVTSVDKVTSQVVAGSLTRINFQATSSQTGKAMKCHSAIVEQPWLNVKNVNVSCYKADQRQRRSLPGGETEKDPKDPAYMELAKQSLRKYLLENPRITQSSEVDPVVERVTTQVVAGSMTRIDFHFQASGTDSQQDHVTMKCHAEVWERPWLEPKAAFSVSCANADKRVKRHLKVPSHSMKHNSVALNYEVLDDEKNGNQKERDHVSSLRGHTEEVKDPSQPEYKILAEEALRKYELKSTVYHKVVEVKRVVTRVVSGLKYYINFNAAPTTCLLNVTSARARSCKPVADVILYCHTEIWDRPWLKRKKIDVNCYADDSEDSDIDLSSKPANANNNSSEIYLKLAEEASEKYLTTSNRKYVHKVTEILSGSEQVTNGSLITIVFSLSPTTCLRNDTTKKSCNLKQPLVVFHCSAEIRNNSSLEHEKEIEVTCKKRSEEKNKKEKRDIGTRHTRQTGDDDDEIDEETTFYYADRAIQHMNDNSNSNNLHKLISIHGVQSGIQMGTVTVQMYLEVAETFCLRHNRRTDLKNCEEMNGLNHRLCLARLWPSPDDELVVRHVTVVCDDDENFESITGVNIPELLKMSIAALERPPEAKYKLVHQGEPQVIPSLDSKFPFKLNFVVATTNCSKDVNLDTNPFQCYINTEIPAKSCHSFIWLETATKYIRYISAKCTPLNRVRRSSLDLANMTIDNSDIQRMVQASLEKLEMTSLHRYKQRILQINSYSTKITSGKVTTIDFDVGYTSCLKYEWVANITSCDFLEHLPRRRCVAQIWERLWINNGQNIDVSCVDDETPLEAHIEFESAEMANELAREALKHIEAKYPHPNKQKVVRIFSLEKQVVAGIHYKMKIEVGFTDCVALSDQTDCKLLKDQIMNRFCRVNVWVRPWTDHPPNFRVSCDFQEATTYDLYHHVQAEHLFYNFLTTYNPSYVNDYSQMQKRFEIFKQNIKKIHELNVHEKGTATYGVTRFTDLSYEEFRSTYMGLKTNLTNENQVPMKMADIPDIKVPVNFDWREYDAVTDVKDQGSCGSCWAFSVTGNIEGQWKMQSGKLVSLSEQELVDCDKMDDGCNGGLPDNAYRAIEQMGGLELESDYPYEGVDEKCAFNKTLAKVQISGAVNITKNETGMAQWLVHNGPISIGINANAMQFYMGGISHPWKMLCNPTNLDHGVLIVGYGIKDYPLFHKKLPYWIVKNSWGKSWGEQGYYRVYRGDGTCGVNQMASSAVI